MPPVRPNTFTMLTVVPRRALGVGTGIILVALLLVGCSALVERLVTEPLTFTSFTAAALAALLLLLAAGVGYWTYGCWSLRYLLDRNALTIAWGGNSCQVPLKDITGVVPGSKAPSIDGYGGVWWPGYRIGIVRSAGISPLRDRVHEDRFPDTVLFFAAGRSDRDLTYVVTPSCGYAISPPDPAAFAQELRIRAHLGPLVEVPHGVRRWPPLDWPAWHDPVLGGLFLFGAVANLALFAVLAAVMPSIPDVAPLHLTPTGAVDLAGPKMQLLGLPVAGLALLLTNTALGAWVHRVERLAGYLVIAWGAGTQLLLWAAWLRLAG